MDSYAFFFDMGVFGRSFSPSPLVEGVIANNIKLLTLLLLWSKKKMMLDYCYWALCSAVITVISQNGEDRKVTKKKINRPIRISPARVKIDICTSHWRQQFNGKSNARFTLDIQATIQIRFLKISSQFWPYLGLVFEGF